MSFSSSAVTLIESTFVICFINKKHRPGRRGSGLFGDQNGFISFFITMFSLSRYASRRLIYTTKALHTPSLVSLMYVTPYPKQSGYINGRERCGCRSPLYFGGTPLQSCFLVLPSTITAYILFHAASPADCRPLK